MAQRRAEREDVPDRPPSPPQGQRSVQPLGNPVARLHDVGAERDGAGDRRRFSDRYVTRSLMDFSSPALQGLRALPQAAGWQRARKVLGIERTSLGSLSEAARVVDADSSRPVVQELGARAVPLTSGREADALKGLTAANEERWRVDRSSRVGSAAAVGAAR